MRIAAIYDIHGNLPALEAVLNDIYQEAVDIVVVGGDVVAGPMPGETLTLLQSIETPTYFIHGNAESEILRHQAGMDSVCLLVKQGLTGSCWTQISHSDTLTTAWRQQQSESGKRTTHMRKRLRITTYCKRHQKHKHSRCFLS